MNTKSHYEKYWSKVKKEEFWRYERNWLLPQFFQTRERVLDLGCGDGAVSEFLEKELGLDVVGMDISKKALDVAKRRGLRVVYGSAEEKFPFKDREFDTVFWGDNVEHLFSPEKTLGEIKRVLKRGGRLVLSCPNMGYWRYRLYYLLNGRLPDTEWTGNPPWAWSHIRFFNSKILRDFLASGKFRVTKVRGVSRRFPDKIFLKLLPDVVGMIFVVEAIIDAK